MLNRIKRMALDKLSKKPVDAPTQLSVDFSKVDGEYFEPVQIELDLSPAQKLEGKTKQLTDATKIDKEDNQKFQEVVQYLKDNKKSLLGYTGLGAGVGALGAVLTGGKDTVVVADPRTGQETLLITEPDDSPVPAVALSGLSIGALTALGLIEGQELANDAARFISTHPDFPKRGFEIDRYRNRLK